ncbi:MAG: hypothetical protein ACYDCN_14455 [Bacteroidia bacterium]
MMRKAIIFLLLCNDMVAQKKTASDFSIIIHEESINKIISAIGSITGSNKYDIYVTDINYKWTLENARLEVRSDSSQFICDVKVEAGILKYKTQVHGDVKISYNPVLNQIQIKIARAIFELYTQLFGKKIHINDIDLADNFKEPFVFEGPKTINTDFDFTMPDNSIKKVYVQPSDCTIELKNKEIVILFEIDVCDVPFRTGK